MNLYKLQFTAPLLCLVGFLAVSSGCAVTRQGGEKTVETIDPMTGKVAGRTTSKLHSWTSAGWPATSIIDKQNASLTSAGSFKLGQEGVSNETSFGTNDVQAIREIRGLLGR